MIFAGCRSATFLPQVWEKLAEPPLFLAALKQKAGLSPDRPADNLMAATYTVRKWKEPR
jgi:AMMECR1 domain-containing protein